MNYIKVSMLTVLFISCNFLYHDYDYISKAMVKGKNIISVNGNEISLSGTSSVLGKSFTKLSNLDIKRLQKSSDLTFAKFNKTELESIRKYTVIDYKKVNGYLMGDRVRNELKIKKKIENIDSAISKYELQDDIVVYRGTNRDYYGNIKVNDIIEEKIYYSTSLVEDVANKFIKDRGKSF